MTNEEFVRELASLLHFPVLSDDMQSRSLKISITQDESPELAFVLIELNKRSSRFQIMMGGVATPADKRPLTVNMRSSPHGISKVAACQLIEVFLRQHSAHPLASRNKPAPQSHQQRGKKLRLLPTHACPGMQLIQPVRLRDGRVLLAAGIALNETHIQRLVERGVEYIEVAVKDDRNPEQLETALREARDRVNFIFRGGGSYAHTALRETIMSYRINELMPCELA